MGDGCQCTNNTQEIGKPNKCSTNTTGIPNSNNGAKPMITNFISYPNKKLIKKQDMFTGIRCFNGTFSLQTNLDITPYLVPQVFSICISEAI